jgi:hypothetical protein
MSEEKVYKKHTQVFSPTPVSGKEGLLKPTAYYSKHIYDVDAIGIYFNVRDLLEKYQLPENSDKEKYINGLVLLIKSYCEITNLDFTSYIKDKHNFLVIPSSSNSYFTFLAYALAHFDIYKIKRFLDYQKENFKGNDYSKNFTNYLEFIAYRTVKTLSLFKTEERLEKIMQWLEKENEKEIPDRQEKTLEESDEFYYWKYGNEKLRTLYQILLREGKIEANEQFEFSFKKRQVVNTNRTKWLVTQTQLVFLIYLIFNGVEHNGETIYIIINRLFVKPDGSEFEMRVLNTTYTANASLFSGKQKLPRGLSSIKKIFEELKINF